MCHSPTEISPLPQTISIPPAVFTNKHAGDGHRTTWKPLLMLRAGAVPDQQPGLSDPPSCGSVRSPLPSRAAPARLLTASLLGHSVVGLVAATMKPSCFSQACNKPVAMPGSGAANAWEETPPAAPRSTPRCSAAPSTLRNGSTAPKGAFSQPARF